MLEKKSYILLTKSEVLTVYESWWCVDTWRASTKVHSASIIKYGILFTEFHVSPLCYNACYLTNVTRCGEKNKYLW